MIGYVLLRGMSGIIVRELLTIHLSIESAKKSALRDITELPYGGRADIIKINQDFNAETLRNSPQLYIERQLELGTRVYMFIAALEITDCPIEALAAIEI